MRYCTDFEFGVDNKIRHLTEWYNRTCKTPKTVPLDTFYDINIQRLNTQKKAVGLVIMAGILLAVAGMSYFTNAPAPQLLG